MGNGFMTKRSCLTNLLEFIELVIGYVEEKCPVDVMFLIIGRHLIKSHMHDDWKK